MRLIKKRSIVLLLAAVMLCTNILPLPAFAAPLDENSGAHEAVAAAYAAAYQAEEEAIAARHGVSVDEIWKRFGGGIPSFLSDELVGDILHGQGVNVITPSGSYIFCPEQYFVDKENGTQRDIYMDIAPEETTELNSKAGIAAQETLGVSLDSSLMTAEEPAAEENLPSHDTACADAEKYGVTEDEIWKRFAGEVPDFLTEEQVRTVLSGEGLLIEADEGRYIFNPEAYFAQTQGASTRSNDIVWKLSLNDDLTLWPEYGKIDYKYSSSSKTLTGLYYIHRQDQANKNRDGRSWVAIQMPGQTMRQAMNETIYDPGFGKEPYIQASVTAPLKGVPSQLRFAYRNKITDWSMNVFVNAP